MAKKKAAKGAGGKTAKKGTEKKAVKKVAGENTFPEARLSDLR